MKICEGVAERLSAIGYEVGEDDKNAVIYCINKAEAALKVRTNQNVLPDGLFYVWVDMAAGYFLTDKKSNGALDGIFDFSAPAKSISEGDTSVTYAIASSGTFEDQFDAMLAKMTHPDNEVILRYRRLTW